MNIRFLMRGHYVLKTPLSAVIEYSRPRDGTRTPAMSSRLRAYFKQPIRKKVLSGLAFEACDTTVVVRVALVGQSESIADRLLPYSSK